MIHGKTLNESGYYHYITLTKHKKINLEGRPCKEDPAYNFTVCIKEKVSGKVGCRLPWDKWSRQDRAVCKNEQEINQFEKLYRKLADANADDIVDITGCKRPCQYKEYKFVESSPKVLPAPLFLGFWAATGKTQVEEEVLLYPFTSLVAEFGGSLGLFLGFSFMTIWQEIRDHFFK